MTHLLNLSEGGTTPFTDVPAWAQPYVGAIYNAGVTSGTSATTYGGSSNVTAVEAALMVMKALATSATRVSSATTGPWPL